MQGTGQATKRPRLSLAVLSLVLFVTFLDNTIIAVALPSIQSDLHAGITSLQWVVSATALTFASLMLMFGTLGDHFGRRRVMVIGLAVFSIASVVGAFAQSTELLIAMRAVMGVGAAASEPGTLSMIRQLYGDRAERAQALGVWSAIAGLALAAGPLIGGTLVGIWSWRAIFVFNVIVGAIALIGVRAILPEVVTPRRQRLDIQGFFWGAIAITAATFATIEGETEGYLVWWIDLMYAFSIVAVAIFIYVERRADEPVLDLRFFRSGPFSAGMIVAFTGFFSTFAVFFFIPLFSQLLGTTSSFDLVLDFLPMAFAMIVASALSGRRIARIGPGLPMAVGCFVSAAGILLTNAFITPESGISLYGWSLVLVGAGLGVVMVAATVSVLGIVPVQRSGMAASAVNTSRELGAVTGVTVLGAIINGQLTTNLLHRLASIPNLPAGFRNLVITSVTTGSTNTAGLPKSGPIADIIKEVLAAAQSSFADGLDLVMTIAGSLMIASGVLAIVLLRRWKAPTEEQASSL